MNRRIGRAAYRSHLGPLELQPCSYSVQRTGCWGASSVVAHSLEALDSPLGLVGHSGLLFQTLDPPLFVHYADLGDLNTVLPSSAGREPVEPSEFPAGIGVAPDEPGARAMALAEALERYCVYAWADDQFTFASAVELGSDAVDLRRLPSCSEREQAHPLCGWRPPSDDCRIRWVRGLSLTTRREVWLPAVAVYLGMRSGLGEHFAVANSTGCACHSDLTHAIVTGLCEVVERDAVALTWLQRLALPRIEFDDIPDWLHPYLARDADGFFERHFFDASTDLGITTIYALETTRGGNGVSTLVACAADLDPARAIAKVIRDLASHRPAVELDRPLPRDPWTFTKSFQGCAFMARPEHRAQFRFLLDSPRRRFLSEMRAAVSASDADAQLAWLVGRLRSCGMEAYVVDLSTDEASAAGVSVVRTLVPDLMPVSFRLPVRYLAHPRLFEAPRRMGHPVYSEEEVNVWPQPFG